MNYTQYIEDHTLRCEASYRGGGIEIDLADLLDWPDLKMTAYQNYLGGGMLGRICNSFNFSVGELTEANQRKVKAITDALNRYYHELTNHEDDEWESATFEANQRRPASAY